jgi:hypothetical protein
MLSMKVNVKIKVNEYFEKGCVTRVAGAQVDSKWVEDRLKYLNGK